MPRYLIENLAGGDLRLSAKRHSRSAYEAACAALGPEAAAIAIGYIYERGGLINPPAAIYVI